MIMSGQPKRSEKASNKQKQSPVKTKYKQIPRTPQIEERPCKFFIYLTFSKAVCTVRGISKSVLIRDFKEHLVLACGVPLAIQRLCYLDTCELNDNANLNNLNIVDNASFRLSVWNDFEKLMRCVHENDFEDLSTCHIKDPKENQDDDDNTDSKDASEGVGNDDDQDLQIKEKLTNKYTKRAETSLFAASQLGRLNIIKNLLEMGVDVNAKTELGYSALHAATAGGWYECIDYLLEKGADCDTKSPQAKKAMHIAEINGFHESERHLRSHEWQIRAKKAQPSQNAPLMMHQQFDSRNPTWFNGKYSTKYICATLPATEFSGTGIDAPKSKPPKTPQNRNKYNVVPDIYVPEDENNTKQHVSFKEDLSFDTWLSNKKHQKLIAIQESIDMEDELLREKEEKEKNRKTRKLIFYEEQKKRSTRVHDEHSDRNKITMYEEYKYLPNYQTSIIRHYMNALMLEHE